MSYQIESVSGDIVNFSANESPEIGGSVEIQYIEISNGIIRYHLFGSLEDGTTLEPYDFDVLEAEDPELAESPVNPTKVFWWLVEKAKEYLCPECI